MADVLVRNVEKSIIERLKRRARLHGRSLQRELKQILEDAAPVTDEEASRIAEAWRRRFGDRTFSDSADLIRADRDR